MAPRRDQSRGLESRLHPLVHRHSYMFRKHIGPIYSPTTQEQRNEMTTHLKTGEKAEDLFQLVSSMFFELFSCGTFTFSTRPRFSFFRSFIVETAFTKIGQFISQSTISSHLISFMLIFFGQR